jgi:hypothetical protein
MPWPKLKRPFCRGKRVGRASFLQGGSAGELVDCGFAGKFLKQQAAKPDRFRDFAFIKSLQDLRYPRFRHGSIPSRHKTGNCLCIP